MRYILQALGCALVGLSLTGGPTAAQTLIGEPTDVHFIVPNATTGQPATAERLTLEFLDARRNIILDTQPASGDFTARAVPIKDDGQYIVTLWYEGVPYWWQKRGSVLAEGPVTLNVFSATDTRDGLSITGLNVVVRYRESSADLEYLVEVTNDAKPQVTASGKTPTLTLFLPEGATQVAATYQRGPEPTAIGVTTVGTRIALAAPLTPGANSIRLTALVPWTGTLNLPVGSDLAIGAWSLLSAPQSLNVEATEMTAADDRSVPGFSRRTGPALEGGREFIVRLAAGGAPGGPQDQLFTTPAPADSQFAAGKADAAKAGKPGQFLVFGGAVVIIVIVVATRRRRT